MQEKQKDQNDILLSQWQICVEMANSVSQRRDAMNNIFITLNLAIIAAVSFVWNAKTVFLLIAGIVLCVIWLLFIRNFKLLNEAKFHVINEIEEKLPMKPFGCEWEKLQSNKKYMDGTKLERALPITFIGLYVAAIVVLLIML
jgi:hypothetical protein